MNDTANTNPAVTNLGSEGSDPKAAAGLAMEGVDQ